MTKIANKKGGANRALVLLSVLIIIMAVVICIPSIKAFNYRSECIACEQAIKSATDGLRIEYLDTFDEDSIRQARKTLAEVMPEREDICPRHGNVYLLKDENGIFVPVCGLHDKDAARRTRLNASYAGSVLEEKRRNILEKAKEGAPEPEQITVRVNNKPLQCTYVTEKVNIKRGTSTTNGYEGIVAFYGTDDDGVINYFVYADEDNCAVWNINDGWSGSAYKK